MVVPAVHLVLMRDNQVLLARRFNTGYEDGNYSLPSGHIEVDETALHAVLREAREEIGLNLSKSGIKPVHVVHRYQLSTRTGAPDYRVDWFFLATDWEGEPKNVEPEKCDELCWSGIDELPENTVPYIRHCLRCIVDGVPFSEFGW